MRRGPTSAIRLLPPEGLVAAAFQHRANAAADPHLHTHLIVCNLGRSPDGAWSAIHSSWWTQRASVGAIYQMSLRHHLGAEGLSLPWRLRDDGFAEVIGVPRSVLRATSSRGRAAAADGAAFGGSSAGRTAGIRATARAQSRSSTGWRPGPTVGGDVGFGPEEAARLLSETRAPAARPGRRGLEQAVTARLASQRSTFRTADVLVALAACTPAGFPAAAAMRWAERYCDAAHPVPGPSGRARRWTTPMALDCDERLWACARRVVARPPRPAGDAEVHAYPDLARQAFRATRDLLAGDRSLHVLQAPAGRTNLLAQAAVARGGRRGHGARPASGSSSPPAATRRQRAGGS